MDYSDSGRKRYGSSSSKLPKPAGRNNLSPEVKAAKINFKATIISVIISAITAGTITIIPAAMHYNQQIVGLTEDNTSLQNSMNTLQTTLQEKDSRINSLNEQIAQDNNTIQAKNNTLDALNDQILQDTNSINSLESQLADEKAKKSSEVNDDLLNQNALLTADKAKLTADNEALRNSLQNALQNNKYSIPSDAVEFEGHYYMIYDYIMNWKAAKEFCELKGGHLVTITSYQEQYFLMDQIKLSDGAYSIGATDEESEGKWKWVTGEDFAYEYWGDGQPDNSGGMENYATMNSGELGKWNDDNGQPHKFICEWDGPA